MLRSISPVKTLLEALVLTKETKEKKKKNLFVSIFLFGIFFLELLQEKFEKKNSLRISTEDHKMSEASVSGDFSQESGIPDKFEVFSTLIYCASKILRKFFFPLRTLENLKI